MLAKGERVAIPLRFGGRARYTGLDVAFDVVYGATARNGKWIRVEHLSAPRRGA